LQEELIEMLKSENYLKSIINREIAIVEEYKTALIAEAVTGKIDVRGYDIPVLPEEEEFEDFEEALSLADEDAGESQTEELEE